MLRQLSSYQLAEVEAFLRIEANPVDEEMEQRVRDQKFKDLWYRFRLQKG